MENLDHAIIRQGTRGRDHGESWTHWVLLDANKVEGLSNEEIVCSLGMYGYGSGPGGIYENAGWVWRVGRRVLAQQFCGYDI